MKIIFASKFYYRRGGLEAYMFKTKKLLEDNGHVVLPFSTNCHENLPSKYGQYFCDYIDLSSITKTDIAGNLKAVKNMFFNKDAYLKVKNYCEKEKPKILQGFGVTKHLSASIFKAAKECGLKTIMRLSDYALMCPNSTALDGADNLCTDFECFTNWSYRCLKKKCIKGSLLASIVGLLEVKGNKILNSYKKYVDHWIAPSMFIRDVFIKYYKIPEEKITYLPIFFDVTNIGVSHEDDGYILYAGRISKEKGIRVLLDAVGKEPAIKLRIAGTGPMDEEIRNFIRSKCLNNVEFLGFKEFDDLQSLIKKSKVVIVPSEWYENSPNIIAEAYAYGKPVIGSRIGGIPELIRDNITGLTFEPGNVDDLRAKIEYFQNNPDKVVEMGKNARRFVEQELTAKKHYEKLVEIYQRVIKS
ncbi:MAG: glycosyltransferase family 4 protein [Candidatus Omnitrophica bacterium]|nr:glycosyltransferase family 4 protein [Candidatus Omnitrophota bacterium]